MEVKPSPDTLLKEVVEVAPPTNNKISVQQDVEEEAVSVEVVQEVENSPAGGEFFCEINPGYNAAYEADPDAANAALEAKYGGVLDSVTGELRVWLKNHPSERPQWLCKIEKVSAKLTSLK